MGTDNSSVTGSRALQAHGRTRTIAARRRRAVRLGRHNTGDQRGTGHMDTNGPLSLHNEYATLNLADLLLARERNHVELMRKANVVGTAVGLYLIRKQEKNGGRGDAPPRTLGNSEVRSYSWPCILVFVDQWKQERELHWQDRLPEAVYLDEKRKVPVCVVYAAKIDAPETPIRPVVYPLSRIGGGFPVIVDVQGREHIASIGCLVRDGHTVYALTNRHVTRSEERRVGKACEYR